ncbi:hypothetical protein CgunFtcFv8_024263 [Champsocephalus gunnari]|uniref:Uncharacterized protein n=1 Tax=Champsocephalus gunnari TaxID=52237 RepID=A0AAN8DEX7_CHAGU|nr:hypothetical protein CgunFtcFv8_024263 [Champsocephalus gunnari]
MKRRTSSAKSKTCGHGLPSPLVCKSPKSVWASCQQGHAVEKQQGRGAGGRGGLLWDKRRRHAGQRGGIERN